jgi:multiple sugar transport system permease protein
MKGRESMSDQTLDNASQATLSSRLSLPGSNRTRRDNIQAYLFLLPFLVVYIAFIIYPVIQAAYMSFFKWDLLAPHLNEFIGLENYAEMLGGTNISWSITHLFIWRLLGLAGIALVIWAATRGSLKRRSAIWLSVALVAIFGVVLGINAQGEGARLNDSVFWTSLGNTLKFVLLSTPLIVGGGLLVALLLNRRDRSAGFYRTLFFAPYVFSVAVTTLIWGFLLNPQRGILAAFLSFFGIEPISWLTDPQLAMPAIVITTLWWTMGFNMVLFLAGLQDIDPSIYEAATIDGAGAWSQFLHITIPGLQRTILLVIILQIIASFQIFGQVFIMTRGGPGGTTRVLIQYIYESGFRDFQLGYAAAMSLFLFVVMLVVSYVQFRVTPQED